MASVAKHYLLTEDQKAANGFTDLFVIKYDNSTLLAESTDNTPASVVLDGLVRGDVVRQDALIEITTAWSGDAALTGTVSLGVVGDTTAITPTLTLTTTGTGAAIGGAVVSANQTDAGYVATTGINLVAEFTPDADSAVDEWTAGEIRIWVNISRRATRNLAQA